MQSDFSLCVVYRCKSFHRVCPIQDDNSEAGSQGLVRCRSIGTTNSPLRSIVEEMQEPSLSHLQKARRNLTSALGSEGSSNGEETRVPGLVRSASWPRVPNGTKIPASSLASRKVCKRSEKLVGLLLVPCGGQIVLCQRPVAVGFPPTRACSALLSDPSSAKSTIGATQNC